MKQFPNNLKYKKYHKINYFYKNTLEKKEFYPNFGEYALLSAESGKITFKQLESCRRTIKRGLEKNSRLWIKIFTSNPITSKPLAVRMGKGKGNISGWVAIVKKGQIIFEISEVINDKAYYIFSKAKTKLPIKTKIMKILF